MDGCSSCDNGRMHLAGNRQLALHCCRFPPVALALIGQGPQGPVQTVATVYPIVRPDGWCFEHRPKEAPQGPAFDATNDAAADA